MLRAISPEMWSIRASSSLVSRPPATEHQALHLPGISAVQGSGDPSMSRRSLTRKQIEQIRERLAEFMSQDDIVERLESVGVPLLAAPKEEAR